MLRGLMIRQGLRISHAVMGLLLLLVLAQAARQQMRPDLALEGVSKPEVSAALEPLEFPSVRERSHYDAILASNLLGPAGQFDPSREPAVEPPPPAPAPVEEADTSLPLRLVGTFLNRSAPAHLAAAVIEVRQPTPKTNTFYLGDAIMDSVVLKEVREKAVVLDNQRSRRLEVLRLDRDHGGPGAAPDARRTVAQPSRSSRPSTTVGGGLVTLQRDDIVKKLEDEYARVASTMVVQEVRGDDGEVRGVTTPNIEDYPVATELGFQNGDVLVSINNEPVRSRDDATQILGKYQKASIFRVGVLRNGATEFITYRVR